MPHLSRSALAVAWTGALVFAASLLWFVYSYLVRFGEPAPAGGRLGPIVTDVILFSAFAIHHSVLARSGAKRRLQAIVPAELERSLYTWVASLLFLAVCTWWQPVHGVLYTLDGWWRAAAWMLQALGVVLTVRAAGALDALELAGVRAVQHAGGTPRPSIDHPPLRTSGLFGFVRHPLYFAWALFVFTTPTMTATRAVFAVISTAYLMIAIPWEERALVETFGAEYERYRRKVRTRMVPGVY